MNPSQTLLLETLYKEYPRPIVYKEIVKALPSVAEKDIQRALVYLGEKGFLKKIEVPIGNILKMIGPNVTVTGYRLTALGVDFIEGQGIDTSLKSEEKIQVVSTEQENESTQPIIEKGSQILDEMDKLNDQMTKFSEEIKKEQKEFQQQFLGRIVEIFGIFIAIFSIIILTINVTTKIDVNTSFLQLIYFSSAMYLPLIIGIIILLVIIHFIVNK